MAGAETPHPPALTRGPLPLPEGEVESRSDRVRGSGPTGSAGATTEKLDLRRRPPALQAELTPFVERLSRRPPGHPAFAYVCAYVPVGRFVKELLERAGVPAHAVRARQMALGDIGLFATIPAAAPPELKPGTTQPVAFIQAGPTLAEVEAALAVLTQRETA